MRKYFALIGAMLSLFIMAGCQGLKLSADTAAVVNYHSSQECGLEKRAIPSKTREEKERLLAEAKVSSQQYDYEKAITLLKQAGISGDEDIQRALDAYEKQRNHLVKWHDNSKIPHLFFHSLIADASKAFDGDSMTQGYQDYMVTIDECKKILNELYKRGYILVNLDDIAKPNSEGEMVYQDILLPPDKKPLVLSQDDVSYYEYMMGDGFPKNLTIDSNGNITNTYLNDKGEAIHGAYDLVPIVDDLVEQHPDFSYKGSKGIIALTGYNGVLGYRTSESAYGPNSEKPNPNIKKDQQQAKKVANVMKQKGWTFASHTWGHLDAGKVSIEHLERDLLKWKREVEPITGPVNTIIFAFGSDIGDWHRYSGEKYDLLKSMGFAYYANVDASSTSWSQIGPDYFRQARINLDGIRMRAALTGQSDVLKDFFDVERVFDPFRPGANKLLQ